MIIVNMCKHFASSRFHPAIKVGWGGGGGGEVKVTNKRMYVYSMPINGGVTRYLHSS